MDISGFFNSYPGMYISQVFFHSLVAAVIVDRAVSAWKIESPIIKQRFSIIVIMLPIVLFPAYQMINSERGSVFFRLEAFFDSNRWLNMELFGMFQLNILFVIILVATTLVSLSQEIIPILIHILRSKASVREVRKSVYESNINGVLEQLPVNKPDFFIIDDPNPTLFSTTGKEAAIFLSEGLVIDLNPEQLQAALAHETAHIERSRRPLLVIVFIVRALMFFNPIALLEFRRAVQEEEKICDDIAVVMTKKPNALAETLKKFYRKTDEINMSHLKEPSTLGIRLEDYSHNMQMENRILRLENGLTQETNSEWFKLVITTTIIIVINYFVV